MPYPAPFGKKAWQYKQVPNLVGGIDASKRSDELGDTFSTTLRNVLIQRGIMEVDTGYKTFGSAVVGIPQFSYQFLRLDTITDQMLVTTSTLYKYNATHSQWQLVKGTAGTTLNGAIAGGAATIVVVSAAGFTTGDLIGIALDSGNQHQTTITVSGTTFTLAASIPALESASSGNVVLRAVALTGTLDHQVSAVTYSGNNWFVFTNGINKPMRYDTIDCVVIPNLPSAGNIVCAAVAVYNSALFLANTTEGGVNAPQRVRRSNQTDPTNWTTGTAGYDDLLDSADPILTLDVLGPYLIVYRDRSIYRGEFVGVGGLNYQFAAMIQGEGLVSAGGVVDLSDMHIIFGHANIYEYRGDFALTPIGDEIYPRLFSVHSDMNPAYEPRAFGFYVEELDEVWFFYPSVASTICNKMLRYAVGDKRWYERVFADSFAGFGFFQLEESFIWTDLKNSWNSQNWKWDSRKLLQQAPTTHLLSATAGQVFEYDYYTTLDNATGISYTVESKDFVVPDAVIRFDMIEMYIQGMSILLEVSTDYGVSWMTLATITEHTMNKVRVFKQFTASAVRFRWSGTDDGFRLDWYGFSFKQESIY